MNRTEIISDYTASLNRFKKFAEDNSDCDQSISKLFPVAIVSGDLIFIFKVSNHLGYQCVLIHESECPLPSNIMAAMDLDFYNTEGIMAVINKGALDSEVGYCQILHEFVHCYQYDDCEVELKNKLSVYQKARENNDYMWEITYPFPYENTEVAAILKDLQLSMNSEDYEENFVIRMSELDSILNQEDKEYMAWQVWKEGYARYVENKLLRRLTFNSTKSEIETKQGRASFYTIGANYFKTITEIKSLKECFNDLCFIQGLEF